MNWKNFGFSIVGVNDEKTAAEIAELNRLLEPIGVFFELKPYENIEDTGYFGISIECDTLERKKTRNAGRKIDYNKSKNYNYSPTIGEVIEWKKTMTHQQIIDKIGCPRATYYRRWKELKEEYGEDLNNGYLDLEWNFIW